MDWYNYVSCLFAGAFLTNAVPHFVHGISGDKFPTPFANPRGIGLSSPLLNVLWSFFNMIAGVLLIWGGKVTICNIWSIVILFIGISAMSIRLSYSLSRKNKE
jgi:hypothetical protein